MPPSPRQPLVSIGLPVLNGARLLEGALHSLLTQDYEPLELIISDNASTDSTPDICRRWAERDSRIQYFRQERTVDPVTNFNSTLHRARGEYFMWAAHDDLWEPEFIPTLAALLQTHADAVLAFSLFDNFSDDSPARQLFPAVFELPAKSTFRRLWRFIRQHPRSGKANLVMGMTRREALMAVGGFHSWPDGDFADLLLIFSLLCRGNLALNDKNLFHKREASRKAEAPPADSSNRRSFSRRSRERLGLLRGYRQILDESPGIGAISKSLLHLELKRQAGWFVVSEYPKGLLRSLRSRWSNPT